jgi:hypothetical protein
MLFEAVHNFGGFIVLAVVGVVAAYGLLAWIGKDDDEE